LFVLLACFADFWGHLWMDGSFFTKLGQPVPWEEDASFNSAESGQVRLC
jgi:hypothetical protein